MSTQELKQIIIEALKEYLHLRYHSYLRARVKVYAELYRMGGLI